MIGGKIQPKREPDVRAAAEGQMQESADELVLNRGQYGHILIGEANVAGDFITADEVRLSMLKTLRAKKELQNGNRDDLIT